MATSNPTLTPKQQKYLSLLQQAEAEQLSVLQMAKQNNLDPSLLYAARKTLRQKGALPKSTASTKFQSVPVSTSGLNGSTHNIELKTQLANGQPIWLSVPAHQLAATLKALSV